jgi:hypothetical protein
LWKIAQGWPAVWVICYGIFQFQFRHHDGLLCLSVLSHSETSIMCQDSCLLSVRLAVQEMLGSHCGKADSVGLLSGSSVMAILNSNIEIKMGYCVCLCFFIE